jgi:hypothetical protein
MFIANALNIGEPVNMFTLKLQHASVSNAVSSLL